MTKQTAVDQFIEKLRELGYLGIDYSPELLKAIKQAKEMEKEQIIDACWAGGDDGVRYYSETYGNNK
jgi:hypothetical protein